MVTSINGNNITWKDDKTGELITDPHQDLEIVNMAYNGNYQARQNQSCCDGWEHKMSNGQWMCGKEHGICEGSYSPGGYLKGPKHERGGIPAIVGGITPIELEGEEYIMNAQTVKRLGVEFFDKLNSTATTYHQGGFQPGQLPDSMYARGGKVPNRRNKMARGRRAPKRGRVGRAPARKMVRGGSAAKRMARGGPAKTMGRRSTAVGKKMYQNGGRLATRGNSSIGLYRNGGGINQYDPCPQPAAPEWKTFITGAHRSDGSVDHYCCKDNHRSDECMKVSDESRLEDLRFAKITNFAE